MNRDQKFIQTAIEVCKAKWGGGWNFISHEMRAAIIRGEVCSMIANYFPSETAGKIAAVAIQMTNEEENIQ